MTTEAQILANRRNALRSTGPRTADGKTNSARNALRHGLSAEKCTVGDEQRPVFRAFYAEIRAAFAPADGYEEQLVERIVLYHWRLRRACWIEARLMTRSCRYSEGEDIAHVWQRTAPTLMELSRYETAIDRALRRTVLLLERRQAQRRGEAVPPPIAVELEIDAPPPATVA